MKVLVTGAKGQLGYNIVRQLEFENIECLGIEKDELDIVDEQATRRFISEYRPDFVVHCAAYTAVDKAEDDRELCYSINVLGTRYVAETCKTVNAIMVYISTDYIFDGQGIDFFETDAQPNPINFYGQTKYEGELEVKNVLEKFFIVRTSWVFGTNGNNFVKTMLRLAHGRDSISIVSDQFGSPTYTCDLAKLISKMIMTDKYGIYHATNEGICSWSEFAKEIFAIKGVSIQVNEITSKEYSTKAARPLNSRMSKKSLLDCGFSLLPEWKDALRRYVSELYN